MTRTALVTITLLSTLATPLVVHATGRAPQERAPTASAASAAPTAAAEVPAAAADTCVRKVRVVYPAYGTPVGAAACGASQRS